jgi:hypothetical protein
MNRRGLGNIFAPNDGAMKPFSQKLPFAKRDILIQGDSVRQIWGMEEPVPEEERKPLRRDAPVRAVPSPNEDTEDPLRLRLSEELDYARRTLDVTGEQIRADRIAVTRHAVALQTLDKVGQMLGHIAAVIRSADPNSAIVEIGMSDLKARLTRRGAL